MEATRKATEVGGVTDVVGSKNSAELEELARFAVEEYNKKANALLELEFGGVVKAKKQVVAGMMYYLTLCVTEGGQKKLYEAEVWVKSWLNWKQLEEFKPLADSSSH